MKEDDGRGRRAAPLEAGQATPPATDIAKELRREAAQWHPSEKSPIRQLLAGAAEIERLRAINDDLLTSLIEITDYEGGADSSLEDGYVMERAALAIANAVRAGKTAAQQSDGEATLQSSIRSEALEVLQEVYTACLSGDFYADHDEATRLLGTMRRALKEGK